ncbi:MAG: serine/threonine-protein kinase, partial [Myxococcota bacterium]
GAHAEKIFVVMELVPGQSLRTWMRQQPPPSWRRCVEVFIEAGEGLAAAHECGLVHRDFKPTNVIVDPRDRPRVLDFGLARQAGDHDTSESTTLPTDEGAPMESLVLSSPLTETGTVLGTPAYMPPEQVHGRMPDARSDQFSFCVSLYEAVYAQRPYEGDTLQAQVMSMVNGEIRPAPRGTKVPGALRRALLRGLVSEPTDRWPSMHALLTELRRIVAPRARRGLTVGLGVGVLGIVAALGSGPWNDNTEQRCTGARAQLQGIWDPTRRAQLRAAVLGTELSYAARTWEQTQQQLDDYTTAWVEAYTEVCEATAVRQEQSEDERSLRVRCLNEHKAVLESRIELLAHANERAVTRAIDMIAGLPRLARCDDVDALRQQQQRVPPPEDPAVAREVDELRQRMVSARALAFAGKHHELLEQVDAVANRARALDYGPLLAELEHLRGVASQGEGRYDEAEQHFQEAFGLALEHRHDPFALNAARDLVLLMGYRNTRHDEALMWGTTIAQPLARAQGDPISLAQVWNHMGVVLLMKGDHEQAYALVDRARRLHEQTLGTDHPLVAQSLGNLGNVLRGQGRLEQAKVRYEQALEIQRRVRGSDHPSTLKSVSNLGTVLAEQGRYEEAKERFGVALRAWQQMRGEDHPIVLHYLNNLGEIASRQENYAEAKRLHERALELRTQTLGDDHPDVAQSLSNLGNVFIATQEYEPALRRHQQALRIRERVMGPDHPDVATSLASLGGVHLGLHEPPKAQEHYQRALKIWESALGTEHPTVSYALVGLARAALEQDEAEAAREPAQRALAIREAAQIAPERTAETRFILGRALWSDPTQRARARALVEQADQTYAKLQSRDRAKTQAWLVEHPAPGQ